MTALAVAALTIVVAVAIWQVGIPVTDQGIRSGPTGPESFRETRIVQYPQALVAVPLAVVVAAGAVLQRKWIAVVGEAGLLVVVVATIFSFGLYFLPGAALLGVVLAWRARSESGTGTGSPGR